MYMQKPVEWSHEKNEWLRKHRNVCFEDVVVAIDFGLLLAIEENTSVRYPNQKMYIVNINGYAYAVPFVEDPKKVFLKTVYASRKFTKKYIIK